MGGRARLAVVAALLLWTWLLVAELPLGSDHVELYADWDHQLVEAEVGVRAVQNGELPLWNPYLCGGLPSFGKPLSRFATPFFLLHLAIEPARALRWEIVAHLFLAALGTALLVARHLHGEALARAAAVLLAACIYSGSSFFALHLTEGHLWVLTAAYLPWVLLAFERGVERKAFAALAGVGLAVMMGEGGALPLPLAVLLLGFYALFLAVRERTREPLVALFVAGCVGALVSAPKLLPMLEFLARHPRETLEPLVYPAEALLYGLVDRDQSLRRRYDWLYWGWQEQGHYVGWGVLALSAVGAFFASGRAKLYAPLAVLFALLAMGPFHTLAPWNLIHPLPLFEALHVTSRFVMVTVLMLAVLAALGLHGMLQRVTSPAARAVIALVGVGAIASDLAVVRHGIFGVLGERPCPLQAWPASAPRGEPMITLTREPVATRRCKEPGAFVRSAMVPAARAGVAIVHAYNALCPRDVRTDRVKAARLLGRAKVPDGVGEIRVPRNFGRKPGLHGVGDPDYRGECWLAEDAPGVARITQRTMNRQRLEVDVPGPTRVVMNQNWDPGWRSDRGRLLEDEAGRLVLALDGPTRGTVALRYVPPRWMQGWALFGAGLASCGLAVAWDRRRPGPVAPTDPDSPRGNPEAPAS